MTISMTNEYGKLVQEMERWNGADIIVKDLDLDLFLCDLEKCYELTLSEFEKDLIKEQFKGKTRCHIEELVGVSEMVYSKVLPDKEMSLTQAINNEIEECRQKLINIKDQISDLELEEFSIQERISDLQFELNCLKIGIFKIKISKNHN